MAKWTTADIPDQRGRRVAVTGANSGLGFHTTLALARAGADVLMGCRNVGKGREAAGRIRAEVPAARLEVLPLDLADLASVRGFAGAVAERRDALDLLVNNAGVMALPRAATADGFEMQLGTNHLGHFALDGLLLPRLLAAPDPRVVTVSSGAHRIGKIDFGDLQGERRYRRWRAYGQSKLANLLFAFELDRRATAAGARLRSVAAHPGYAATNLQSRGPQLSGSRLSERFFEVGNAVFAQSESMGALPVLYAATVPELPGASYVGPDGPLEMRGHPKVVDASDAAKDPVTARRLWEESERLTGVSYEFAVPAAA